MTRALLNLDELFRQPGEERPRIRWQGQEYTLRLREDLSAEELLRIARLYDRLAGRSSANVSAEEMVAVVQEALGVLCPSLDISSVPFAAQMEILNFALEQARIKAPKAQRGEGEGA